MEDKDHIKPLRPMTQQEETNLYLKKQRRDAEVRAREAALGDIDELEFLMKYAPRGTTHFNGEQTVALALIELEAEREADPYDLIDEELAVGNPLALRHRHDSDDEETEDDPPLDGEGPHEEEDVEPPSPDEEEDFFFADEGETVTDASFHLQM